MQTEWWAKQMRTRTVYIIGRSVSSSLCTFSDILAVLGRPYSCQCLACTGGISTMKSILGHRVFVLRRSWAAGERRRVLLTTRSEKWETDGDCDFVRGTVFGFISMTRGDWDRFDSIDIRDARVQSGGPGQRWGREIRPHRAVRHRDVHWEVRPHYRGFLPQGDRGGLLALGAGDPWHRRYRAVRLHAGPLHQERARIHTGLQPRQPAELPGHKADEGSDHKSEKVGESPDC